MFSFIVCFPSYYTTSSYGLQAIDTEYIGFLVRVSGSRSADAACGILFLDKNGQASLYPLFQADGGYKFVGVPDTGDGLGNVRHLP